MSRARIAVVAVAALLISAAVSIEGNNGVGGDSRIVGSWNTVHTPEEGGPPPFQALFTIHEDGTVLESDDGPPTPHLFTAGHGAWNQIGRNDYLVTYWQINFDEAANTTGMLKVRVQFKLGRNDNVISGPAIVDFYDPDGNLVFTGEGEVAGKRIRPERLN